LGQVKYGTVIKGHCFLTKFFIFYLLGWLSVDYSCGQAKPTNKNGNTLMTQKMFRKRADMLREAPGQISVKLHEPLWRKCPYTEIVPKIVAGTPKSAEKNMKNSAITSFHGKHSAQQVSKPVINWFS
jgi:hypothetical protein